VLPDRAAIRPEWDRVIGEIFAEARLEIPQVPFPQQGGREMQHGEALGHMLAEMQVTHRAHPGAVW
jgi:ring-1,2-phenylacetyl-CoA epoxidase subunit PaaC